MPYLSSDANLVKPLDALRALDPELAEKMRVAEVDIHILKIHLMGDCNESPDEDRQNFFVAAIWQAMIQKRIEERGFHWHIFRDEHDAYQADIVPEHPLGCFGVYKSGFGKTPTEAILKACLELGKHPSIMTIENYIE